jgi:hypothetical protein
MFPGSQASGDVSQSPVSDLCISIRIGMHGLIRDAVAQEFLVERQEDMQKLIVNTHYAVEDLIKILWLHQGHGTNMSCE